MHDPQPVLPNVSKQDAGKEIGQSSNFIHFNFIIIFERFAHCRRIDIEGHFPEMKILKNNSWQFQVKGVKTNRRQNTNVKNRTQNQICVALATGRLENREFSITRPCQARANRRGLACFL